jgi:hypothetical protein
VPRASFHQIAGPTRQPVLWIFSSLTTRCTCRGGIGGSRCAHVEPIARRPYSGPWGSSPHLLPRAPEPAKRELLGRNRGLRRSPPQGEPRAQRCVALGGCSSGFAWYCGAWLTSCLERFMRQRLGMAHRSWSSTAVRLAVWLTPIATPLTVITFAIDSPCFLVHFSAAI